uniref:Uncharacterized protein n=1 Tax=Panagrellus redivivus TaxID=6233 RepID=A0A7E4VXA0_PANRE
MGAKQETITALRASVWKRFGLRRPLAGLSPGILFPLPVVVQQMETILRTFLITPSTVLPIKTIFTVKATKIFESVERKALVVIINSLISHFPRSVDAFFSFYRRSDFTAPH